MKGQGFIQFVILDP